MERQMWQLLEPVHAIVYYAPEVFEEFAALGYDVTTRWPSYFALRSAPLGTPSAELVSSTFYSFNPKTVAEHIPAIAGQADILRARLRGVDRALRRLLGEQINSPELVEAAHLAKTVAQAANTVGRPLAAANAALPWPEEPHLVLWQAATIIREHRGDGHVAALLTAGLDGCEALVSFAAVGAAPVEVFVSRQWGADEWAAARARLVERGWVDADGNAIAAGKEGREAVERVTDELAAAPWQAIGPAMGRLAQLVMPVTMAIVQSGLLPAQSTLGIGR
jgi:helix-turn-helix protein